MTEAAAARLDGLPADLELRLVRYFLAVAEQGHFGRAAAALYVTQPSLSRQVKRLESQLGVRLLDRTPQGAELTDAGRVFVPLARDLLLAADHAAADARAAAQPDSLTIGYTANLIVTPAVRALRRQHPEADVRTLHLEWNGAHEALVEHHVDVAIARRPLRDDRLDVDDLYEVPRVLVVPSFHRLAGRAAVTLADFEDEPLPRAGDPVWDGFWRIDPRPDGRPAPYGPFVESLEDKLEVVAGGDAVCVAPVGGDGAALRSDLVAVPIDGIEPSQVVVATRSGDDGLLVRAFRAAARELLRGQQLTATSA